jgi:hypothetical protein
VPAFALYMCPYSDGLRAFGYNLPNATAPASSYPSNGSAISPQSRQLLATCPLANTSDGNYSAAATSAQSFTLPVSNAGGGALATGKQPLQVVAFVVLPSSCASISTPWQALLGLHIYHACSGA